MENLTKIISGYIFFFISNLGYWEYFRKKTRMSIFFIPAFTISLQITLLFCSGLLNCLGVASVILFVTGLLFAVYYSVKNVKDMIRAYLNVGYIFFVIFTLLIMLAVRGKIFTHVDNFSHWAIVVKNMLETNRYPCFKDTLIGFKTYPLGSATYIYYVAKIIMDSEQIMMFAQAYFMLSLILPVFKYVKNNKAANCIYVILYTNYIFSYQIQIYDLLVETLLPLHGMMTLFFVFSECLGLDTKSKKGNISVLYAIPLLCTLTQIKNSSIFFLAIICILVFVSFKYEKTEIGKKVITISAPFLSLYLWKAHYNYVFAMAATSSQAMTIENYQNHISSKAGEEIWNIFRNVLKFSVTGKELLIFLIPIFLIVLLTITKCEENRNTHVKMLLLSIGIYVMYMFGLFFTYVFSMSKEEAASLASAARYRSTIFIAIYYLLLLLSLLTISDLENIKRRWIYSIAVYGMFLVLWIGRSMPYGTFTIFTYNDKPEVLNIGLRLRQTISENNVLGGKSYIICNPPTELAVYVKRLCRYLLYSDTVSVCVITQTSQLDDARDYDYIFIYDTENEMIQEWLNVNYPAQAGNSVIMLHE